MVTNATITYFALPVDPCPNGFSFVEINGTCSMFNPCPSGAICLGGVCCDYQLSKNIPTICPNNANPNGPCSENEICPENYSCLNGFCCFSSNSSSLMHSSVEISASLDMKNHSCLGDTVSLNTSHFCNSTLRCPSSFYCFRGFCCSRKGINDAVMNQCN